MAAKKNASSEAKKETKDFLEFEYEGKTFDYEGRIYPKKEGKGNVVSKHGMSITLNKNFTIKGCNIVETADSFFISWPQYSAGDAFKSYIYIDKVLNDEIDKLTQAIADILISNPEF